MPTYCFVAKTRKGETETGTREAKDQRELARILRHEGYILISATLEKAKKKKLKLQDLLGGILGVPLTEKIMFTRNLQVMIAAGVPLPRALDLLAVQAQSKKLKDALIATKEDIIKGKSFSEALRRHPDVFSEIFFSMVKVGEETGNLEEVLKNLTLQMEREHDLKSKIKGAMIYPSIIILAMMGIGLLMLVMVVPKLAATFEELGLELPPTTKMVIFLATLLTEKWYLFLLALVPAFFLFRLGGRTKGGRKTMDKLFLRLPIISPLIKKTNAAFTVRTLSNLIASGVPIVRSLEVVSKAVDNFYFQQALEKASQRVEKGAKLAEVLEEYRDLFPVLVIQMIMVGEETGQTSSVLRKLADYFEEEVATATKNLASVIEPIIMLAIGVGVGFFAVSMIQPMYAMLGAL